MAFLKILVAAVFVLLAQHAPVYARESKLQRKQNALAVRQFVYSLEVLSDQYARDPKSVDTKLKDIRITLKKFSHKLQPDLLKRFEQILTGIETSLKKNEASETLRTQVQDAIAYTNRLFVMVIAPAQIPEYELGMRQYQAHCALCHGQDGDPTSALVKNINPRPRSFHEPVLQEHLSPFRIYNTLLVGINGSHVFDDRMNDHELWSVAFYVLANNKDAAPTPSPEQQQALKKSFNLKRLSENDGHQIDSMIATTLPKSTPQQRKDFSLWLRKLWSFDRGLSRDQ
jgi:mono/diheme cytochrome c family protein